MTSEHQFISRKDEGDRVIIFERGDLVFVFNFHWTNSYFDYRIGCSKPGKYKVCPSTLLYSGLLFSFVFTFKLIIFLRFDIPDRIGLGRSSVWWIRKAWSQGRILHICKKNKIIGVKSLHSLWLFQSLDQSCQCRMAHTTDEPARSWSMHRVEPLWFML